MTKTFLGVLACALLPHRPGVKRYLDDALRPIGAYRPVVVECPRCGAYLGSHIEVDRSSPAWKRTAAAHARLGMRPPR